MFERLDGVEPESDNCIIAPRRRAGSGHAQAMIAAIHGAHFSIPKPVIGRIWRPGFCVGDPLVCDVYHWDVDLMNGSLRRIVRMATTGESEAVWQDRSVRGVCDAGIPLASVHVDGELSLLDDLHLHDCSWGYALTCQRARGSDIGRVIVVLDGGVDRGWLYTVLNRGGRQVVLIGTPAQFHRIMATMPKVNDRHVALDPLLDRAMVERG